MNPILSQAIAEARKYADMLGIIDHKQLPYNSITRAIRESSDINQLQAHEIRDLALQVQQHLSESYASDNRYKEHERIGNYRVFVSVKPYSEKVGYIAVAEHPRTGEVFQKANHKTQEGAVLNLSQEIEKATQSQKRAKGVVDLDFNAELSNQLLNDSGKEIYARVMAGPHLVVASKETEQDPEKLAGYHKVSIRLRNKGETGTVFFKVRLSSAETSTADLIHNGRYVVGKPTKDDNGDMHFPLMFDSVVMASNENVKMGIPGLTVATPRRMQEGKLADKDWDGDGKLETPEQEYLGSRDKAIKEKMKKDIKKESFSGAVAEHYAPGLYGNTKKEVIKNIAKTYLGLESDAAVRGMYISMANAIEALSDAYNAGRDSKMTTEAKTMTPRREKIRSKIVKGMEKSKEELKKMYGDRWEDVMYATATKKAMGEAKTLTPKRQAEREKIIMGMKKNKEELKKRYGDRWEEVMYATATKQVMEQADTELNPMGLAVMRRIMFRKPELIEIHGLDTVEEVVADCCLFYDDMEEIGTSDVSGAVREVEKQLNAMKKESYK